MKLALVKDDDCLGLEEAIIVAGEEGPYECMSITSVSKSSLGHRTPSPFSKQLSSPFPSSSQISRQLSSLGDYSPLSLPSLSDVLRPSTPIEGNAEGDIVYMGKKDVAPSSSHVDFEPDVKPDVCFCSFFPCFSHS